MGKLTIAEKKHRLVVCSMKDVVVVGEGLRLTRKGIFSGWAKITPKSPSPFAPNGSAFPQSTEKQTHEICMTYNPHVEISTAAWLFEERRISSPRWFKVLEYSEINDCGKYWKFKCRLVERGDDISRPAEVAPEKEAGLLSAKPISGKIK